MTLSSLATLLVETYLPEAYQNYLCMNYMQTSQYRTYKSFVPEYLRDRPRSTIIHCLTRKSKALKYCMDDICAGPDQSGVFEVKGSNGKTHTVDFGLHAQDKMPSCTCPDWTQWQIPCKHFFGVFRLHPEWDWYKLPQHYLKGSYMTIDQPSLDNFFKNIQSDSAIDQHDDTFCDNRHCSKADDEAPSSSRIPKLKVSVTYKYI